MSRRGVGARLRQGESTVIEVPNIDSDGEGILGRRWAQLDPSGHGCHSAPRSLILAHEAAGDTVVGLQTPTHAARGPLLRVRAAPRP